MLDGEPEGSARPAEAAPDQASPSTPGEPAVAAAEKSGAAAEQPRAEDLLRAHVMRAGPLAGTGRAERARLTPATLVALVLLVVSAGASLTYVLARGGVALPSAPAGSPAAAGPGATPSSRASPGATPSAGPSIAPAPSATIPATSQPTQAPTVPPDRRYAETDPAIAYSGTWASAANDAYAGGAVAWTTSRGASATLSFTGRKITWYGPVGPTRGSAAIYLDGGLVRTVSQYASTFSARQALFSHDFGQAGAHAIRIVVVGTPGHPMVAVDELVIAF